MISGGNEHYERCRSTELLLSHIIRTSCSPRPRYEEQ